MTTQKTVTIRVTDSRLDTYWYSDLEGEEFEVVQHPYREEYTLAGGEAERSLHIAAEDCEVVDGSEAA